VFDVEEKIESSTPNSRQLYLNAFGFDESDWMAASPLLNVNGETPDFLLIYQNRRSPSHEEFAAALSTYGNQATLFNADPFDHSEINRLIGNFDLAPEMTQSVLDFFGDCLREPPVEEPPLTADHRFP